MKSLVGFLVAVAIAAVLLGAFPAIVGADHGVPFKGRAELTRTSVQVQQDGSVLMTFVGTGNGTHLGQFTEEASVVVHTDGSFSAIVVLTAANGDQVFKSAQGASISAGTFTVNGGTGRFRNATGTGVVSITALRRVGCTWNQIVCGKSAKMAACRKSKNRRDFQQS